MALLKDVQVKIPSADTVAGRVIAFHENKHYDLGEYVGEGVVRLSKEGEALMAPPAAVEDSTPKRVPRKAAFSSVSNSDLG